MNSEKTPFVKQKKSAQKKKAVVQEKKGKRKQAPEENTRKAKVSKKKLNFDIDEAPSYTQKISEQLGVRRIPDPTGPSANLRSKRRLRFTESETKTYNEDLRKLRQQYRDKIGPTWRQFIRCQSESSDEETRSASQRSLPPGASGTYIRYHLVNNGSDIVGVREYY